MDRSGAPRDPAQPLEDWYEIGFEPGLVLNGMDGEKLWTVKATVFLLCGGLYPLRLVLVPPIT